MLMKQDLHINTRLIIMNLYGTLRQGLQVRLLPIIMTHKLEVIVMKGETLLMLGQVQQLKEFREQQERKLDGEYFTVQIHL